MKKAKKKEKEIPPKRKEQGTNRQFLWRSVSIVLICLVGVLAYSNSFDCSFHFDDGPTIEDNVTIRSLSNVKAWWRFCPSRPIGCLSFALNYHFHRLDVWGYHLVNLVIHICNGVLVWWLVMLTMTTPVMKAQPVNRRKESMAVFTALLFVSHPLATQAVTYIVQRFASLATLFYLLSLALYVKGRLGEGNYRRQIFFYYTGSVLCAVLGMLTKEIVFTLPFALVLYEFSFIKSGTWRIDIKDGGIQIPIIILAIFVALFFLNFSFGIFNPIPPLLYQAYDYPITAWEYLLTQFSVVLTYIRLFIAPVSQNLDYDYPISHSLFEIHTLFGLLSLSGILVLGIFLFRRYRIISFGIFWFFLTLSVESSVIPISQNVIFEHRTYLPGFGFLLALTGAFFYFLYDGYKQVAVGIMALIILTNTVLTFERNKVWKDDYTLWGDSVKKSPNKPRPLCNYGKAVAEAGNASNAFTYYDKAIEGNPRYYGAYYNRGNAKTSLGDYQGAVADYEEALKIKPDLPGVHFNQAYALARQSKMLEAIVHLKEAVRLNPSSAEYHNNLAHALERQGNTVEAVAHLKEAVRLKPGSAEYHKNLAYALERQGNMVEAVVHLKEAVRLNPSSAEYHNYLGYVLALQGEEDQAIVHFREALRVNPDFKLAKDNLKNALAMQNKKMNPIAANK